MMLNTLLIAILIYFAFKSIRNLYRALKENRSAQNTGMFEPEANRDEWNADSAGQVVKPRRKRKMVNVEDAKWEDL